MADYSRVVSGGLTFAGYDQGIDFTGSGDVYAAAAGVVTRVERGTFHFIQGTGSIIVYRITDGRYIYVMEAIDVTPGLQVGDKLVAGEIVGTVTSAYPGIEMGWANAAGSPLNPLGSTSGGRDFAAFVTTTVAPPPGPTGTLENTSAAEAGSAHHGWTDLRNTTNKHLPTQLARSQALRRAALRSLGVRSKVR